MLKAQLYHESNINAQWEVISASAWGFDDLMIVPCINVEIGGGHGTIKVTHELIAKWGVASPEVIEIALSNMSNDYTIKSIAECFRMLELEPSFYVVSTHDRTYGAIAIWAARPELKEKFNSGFSVIPSSLHEVLVVPNELLKDNALINSMINEVNTSVVDRADILSNHCYNF